MLAPPAGPPATRGRAPSLRWRGLAASLSAALVAGFLMLVPAGVAHAAPTLLSQGKPATASSHGERRHPRLGRLRRQHRHPLVQRRSPTRSGSRSTSAPPATVSQVDLNWEAAYGEGFQIQASTDGPTWTTPQLHHHGHRRHRRPSTSPAPAATSACTAPTRHRVRLLAVGVPGPHRHRTGTAARVQGGGDLGPNVHRLRPLDARTSRPSSTRSSPAGVGPVRHRPLRAAVQAGHLQRHQRPARLLHLDRRPRPEPRRRHHQR